MRRISEPVSTISWVTPLRQPVSSTTLQKFSLQAALNAGKADEVLLATATRRRCYASYLEQAAQLATELQQQDQQLGHLLEGELGQLQFFALPA